jgi:hypothetical protein
LLTLGIVPWIEVLFPAWVFIFSVHILVASLRSPIDQPVAGPAADGGPDHA